MNVIGKTTGGGTIVGMSSASYEAIKKLSDGARTMPSGLILAELSETQIAVLSQMTKLNKPNKQSRS